MRCVDADDVDALLLLLNFNPRNAAFTANLVVVVVVAVVVVSLARVVARVQARCIQIAPFVRRAGGRGCDVTCCD
jgi:hypothetical protein